MIRCDLLLLLLIGFVVFCYFWFDCLLLLFVGGLLWLTFGLFVVIALVVVLDCVCLLIIGGLFRLLRCLDCGFWRLFGLICCLIVWLG